MDEGPGGIEDAREEPGEEFGELLKFTLAGFAGGLVLAVGLDSLSLSRSALGQWIVRTLAGEGESIFEGIFAMRKRALGGAASMAEAYGWGKFFGIAFPWIIDGLSRLAGIDVYGIEGFYIPFFYALSDQIGGNVSGFMYIRRRSPTLKDAGRSYFTNPVMVSGLVLILAVPLGLLAARMMGFSPSTQVRTALETIMANLCWVPPLLGWLAERRGAHEDD
jgi:hypothetical protein